MSKLVLALTALSLFACGEVEDSDTCNVYDENYSHTVIYCNDEVVHADIFCDDSGVHERDMCVGADQLPDIPFDNCENVNKCWRI
mgnify:FL=1